MDFQELDTIVRASGATLMLLLAGMLVRDDRERRIAAHFFPLAVCLSGFLIGNTPDPSLRLHGVIAAAAHLASGYVVPFLWWFCLASFDRTFRPRGATLFVGLAWLVIASADRAVFGQQFADKGLSWLLVAIGFAIIGHLAWRLIRDRRGDLLEQRRGARVAIVVALAALLFVELSKEVVFGIDWRPSAYTIAENAAVLAFALWLLSLLARVDAHSISGEIRSPPGLQATGPARETDAPDSEGRLIERLRVLIEVERIYLDPAMTFEGFVQRMGAPERVVRRLINHRLGHDHFRSFLNAFRVAEAQRLLADPNRAEEKLIAIALDSGFASLASFNRVFRAVAGCAPSAFRVRQPDGAEAAAGRAQSGF